MIFLFTNYSNLLIKLLLLLHNLQSATDDGAGNITRIGRKKDPTRNMKNIFIFLKSSRIIMTIVNSSHLTELECKVIVCKPARVNL